MASRTVKKASAPRMASSMEGKICSPFDITLGFEMEATGMENITYRSYLHGETPKTLSIISGYNA